MPDLRQTMVPAKTRWKGFHEMAGRKGKAASQSLRYFYLNGDLYHIDRIDRHQNLADTFRYKDGARVGFIWSDIRRNSQRAFRFIEVCRMLNIHRDTLTSYLNKGLVKEPQRMYSRKKNVKPYNQRMFSEDEVLDIWELIMHTHRGRPRADGRITHRTDVPTKGELMAMLKDNEVLYYKDPLTGEFSPVWKAPEW